MTNSKMAEPLRTRNAFLDTNIFMEANFNFKSASFERLKTLSRNGSLNLFVTDLTLKELKSNILDAAKTAAAASRAFRQNAKLLADLEWPGYEGVFQRLDAKAVALAVQRRLDAYLEDCTASTIAVAKSSIETVFDAYFEGRAPFIAGKSRTEFPDAFMISALELWCSDNVDQMYVVTRDAGVREACSGGALIPLESLDQLLEMVTAQDRRVTQAAVTWYEAQWKWIVAQARQKFADLTFSVIEDEKGPAEAYDVEVDKAEILDAKIIDANGITAVFHFDFKISFVVSIQYYDDEDGLKDPETGEWVYRPQITKRGPRESFVPVGIQIDLNVDMPEMSQVLWLEVNGDGVVDILFWGDDTFV